MDKNQNFYDPYNFNVQQPNIPPSMPMMNNTNDIPQDIAGLPNPAMYYDQQYMYYRYLTQVVEYKIKVKELERLANTNS